MSFQTQRNPVGYQQLTVSSAAVALTLPTRNVQTGDIAGSVTGAITQRVSYVTIRCATANVRWRDDGTDPTASVGVPLNAGEELDYDGNPAKIKFIRVSADATLDIAYYN